MPIRIFSIPIRDPLATEAELNAFLSNHRIISLKRKLVDVGLNSFWTICVEYCEQGTVSACRVSSTVRNRIDYKTVLSPQEFDVFSKLRSLRKEAAQAEGVPVYTLFTNDQLAQMVQRRCQNRGDLLAIDGIGEARVEKIADQLLHILAALQEGSLCLGTEQSEGLSDAKSEPSV